MEQEGYSLIKEASKSIIWRSLLLAYLCTLSLCVYLNSNDSPESVVLLLDIVKGLKPVNLTFILSFVCLTMLFMKLEIWKKKGIISLSKKIKCLLFLTAILFAVFTVLGYSFETNGSLGFLVCSEVQVLKTVLVLFGFSIIGYALLSLLYHLSGKRNYFKADCLFADACRQPIKWYFGVLNRHSFITTFVSTAILTLPNIILSYPGQFMGDSTTQIVQWLPDADGLIQITNHHPVLHSAFIHLCIMIGRGITNSWNVGIFIYVLVQSSIFIGIFAYLISYLKKDGLISEFVVFLLILYTGLHLHIQNYMVLVTKDGLFTVMLMIFCLQLYRVLRGDSKKGVFIGILLAAEGMILLRNEGIYLVLPVFAVLLFKKTFRRNSAIVFLTLVILHFFWGHMVLPAFGIEQGSKREMLSIPLQQVARCVRDNGKMLTEDEKQMLNQVLPYDELGSLYDPVIADPVKSRFDDSTPGSISSFLKIWFQLLKKYPSTYLQAFLHNKYQYIYLSEDNWNYFDYKWSEERMALTNELREEQGTDFYHPSILKNAREFFETVKISFAHLPGMRLLISSATYIYVFLIWLVFSLIKKNRKAYPFLVLVFMQVLVIMAGPTNGYYFRYTYPLAVCLPFLLIISDSLKNNYVAYKSIQERN